MVVELDCFLVALLEKPGMVLSASLLWSLLFSLFLLLDLRFTEEWRDPEEGPGDGLLDLLLDDEEGLLSSTSLLPDRLVPGSVPVIETPD